jgi:hypothetical protein
LLTDAKLFEKKNQLPKADNVYVVAEEAALDPATVSAWLLILSYASAFQERRQIQLLGKS